jgi:hypothetical protein
MIAMLPLEDNELTTDQGTECTDPHINDLANQAVQALA